MKHITLFLSVFAFSLFQSVVAEGESTVLLITSPELKTAWKPFADWKNKQRRPVKIITTAAIVKDFQGADIQEKIRKCVRKNIDKHGIRWVILGGDSLPGGKGHVPDRDTVHKNMWGNKTDIPTDIYYLSPTNWDADGDGIYGEFEDDREAITYPDGRVGLGRIPVRTAADVKAYTDKVISYESKYPKGEFGKNFIYTCEVKAAYAKVKRSWDDHVSKVLQGGEMHRYFTDKTPWDKDKPGDYDLTPDNWVKMLNSKKTGKFHFHGHGLLHCWVLEKRKIFTKEHIRKLTNKDAYPIITTVSCFTGHYDAIKDPCISESMLRAPNAGAIAIVAPCREGKPHFLNPRKDFQLMVREGKMDGTTTTMTYFWEKGIGQKLTTGEALMQTKASLAEKAKKSANFHMCIVELNLLGDPTIAVHPAANQ
ncbi:MAG: C25 family cysteine peptidase [Akkermansiaceae bacterium]